MYSVFTPGECGAWWGENKFNEDAKGDSHRPEPLTTTANTQSARRHTTSKPPRPRQRRRRRRRRWWRWLVHIGKRDATRTMSHRCRCCRFRCRRYFCRWRAFIMYTRIARSGRRHYEASVVSIRSPPPLSSRPPLTHTTPALPHLVVQWPTRYFYFFFHS